MPFSGISGVKCSAKIGVTLKMKESRICFTVIDYHLFLKSTMPFNRRSDMGFIGRNPSSGYLFM